MATLSVVLQHKQKFFLSLIAFASFFAPFLKAVLFLDWSEISPLLDHSRIFLLPLHFPAAAPRLIGSGPPYIIRPIRQRPASLLTALCSPTVQAPLLIISTEAGLENLSPLDQTRLQASVSRHSDLEKKSVNVIFPKLRPCAFSALLHARYMPSRCHYLCSLKLHSK